MISPTNGDRIIGMTTFSHTPDHSTVADPASAAPTSPPMRACEDDEGRPFHHVIRFQQIAPIRAAAQMASPVAPEGASMMPLPTVLATLVPRKAPTKLAIAAMP